MPQKKKSSGILFRKTFMPVPQLVADVCAGTEKVQRDCNRANGRYRIRAATAPGQGGGLLDRPTIDKPTPGRESEFDVK